MLLSAFQNIYISNLLSKAVSAAPAMFHFLPEQIKIYLILFPTLLSHLLL